MLALHVAGGVCASTACSRRGVLALHAAGGVCASTACSRRGVC